MKPNKFAAAVLLEGSTRALAQTKRLVKELRRALREGRVDLRLKYHMPARESDEAREGIAAFNEKRKPNWAEL